MDAVVKPVIDHVVIQVSDQLDQAAALYRRLGFQLTERGHHSLGSSNHLAIFGTDYLELLGYEPERASAGATLWKMPNGLGGLVFKPTAAPDFRDKVAAAGLPVAESREFTRPVALPGGTRDAHFRVTHLEPEVAFNGRVFFCHHFTPELVWRQEWQRHANGVTGIAEFGIVSGDPERAVAPYRRLFGDDAVVPAPGGVAIAAGQARVLILSPEAASEHWGKALPALPGDGAERMVALGLHVTALDTARQALKAGGIAARETQGRLIVPAESAFGLALAFQS